MTEVRPLTRRFGPWLAAGAAIVAVAAVLVGRWEGDRADDEQRRGIARTRALAGPSLESERLSGYRITAEADCLLYELGGNPYAVELCFDERGRLIEAIDRRRRETEIWSLRHDPEATRLAANVEELFRLLVELGAIPEAMPFRGELPLAPSLRITEALAPGDTGPVLVRRAERAQ